ncbi:hypothetical protein, partial [Streptococcus thermophilus]
FHYSSYGTFCVHSKSSIISTVVLPTTEIIEPFLPKNILKLASHLLFCKFIPLFFDLILLKNKELVERYYDIMSCTAY